MTSVRGIALTALALSLLGCNTVLAQDNVHADIKLPGPKEPAREDNPPCASQANVTTADAVLAVVGAAIDTYVGYPVATGVLENLDNDKQNQLKVMLGIHDGKSTCATLCVVIPKTGAVDTHACMRDAGGQQNCRDKDGKFGGGPSAVINMSIAQSAGARLYCATGKNWQQGWYKYFSIGAKW